MADPIREIERIEERLARKALNNARQVVKQSVQEWQMTITALIGNEDVLVLVEGRPVSLRTVMDLAVEPLTAKFGEKAIGQARLDFIAKVDALPPADRV